MIWAISSCWYDQHMDFLYGLYNIGSTLRRVLEWFLELNKFSNWCYKLETAPQPFDWPRAPTSEHKFENQSIWHSQGLYRICWELDRYEFITQSKIKKWTHSHNPLRPISALLFAWHIFLLRHQHSKSTTR